MEGLISFIIIAAIVYLLIRKRVVRPTLNDLFACSGCGIQKKHTQRTVAAWKRGSRSFFCRECHGKWRDKQNARKSGCLGMAAFIL